VLTDAELDTHLHAAVGRMQAALDEHIDVDVWLRDVLRRVEQPAQRRPRRPRVRLLVRAWCRTAFPVSRLARFRAWFVVCAALTLYLAWVVVVEYRVRSHDPAFILGNLAVLLAWWPVLVRTYVAWGRVPAGGAR
jgi:hypothetical protein